MMLVLLLTLALITTSGLPAILAQKTSESVQNLFVKKNSDDSYLALQTQGSVLQSETTSNQYGFTKVIPGLLRALSNTGLSDATETGSATTPTTGTGAPTNTGSLPSGPVDISETVEVTGGIRAHKSIAANFERMIAAANVAGLPLSASSGWRDPQKQIDLRRQNCGPTEYDIYQRPSGECDPPTAIPGTSNHEGGLAFDLACGDGRIETSSDPCFVWLSANAAAYGLKNLPIEPWHWSVDGR